MTAKTPDTTNLETAPQDAEGDVLSTSETGVSIYTEKLDGQQRRILAFTEIPATADQVWQVITDYDNLASFIPNLSCSQRISHPEGGIRLEQIGSQCFLNIKFCARVVLDMVEQFPNQIDFEMVEGDFKQFCGSWMLQPANGGTDLCYTVSIVPPRAMPVGLVERKLKSGLVANLTAIRQRAELCSGMAG